MQVRVLQWTIRRPAYIYFRQGQHVLCLFRARRSITGACFQHWRRNSQEQTSSLLGYERAHDCTVSRRTLRVLVENWDDTLEHKRKVHPFTEYISWKKFFLQWFPYWDAFYRLRRSICSLLPSRSLAADLWQDDWRSVWLYFCAFSMVLTKTSMQY